MTPEVVVGDILSQEVEVIVNSWNRNIIPWWLLIPSGVSAAIKRKGGNAPFRELARMGAIPLGEARITSAGRLNYKAIIHVAGINMFWIASEYSVRSSVLSSIRLVNENGFASVAFPLIGSGAGNRSQDWSLEVMTDALRSVSTCARVVVVKYSGRSE